MASVNELYTRQLDAQDSPDGISGECVQFIIYDEMDPFVLSGITIPGREYTFSCWSKTESEYPIYINGTALIVGEDWTYITHTFTATETDLNIRFSINAEFYMYHPQLELGNKATDWTPSPEDTAEDIESAQGAADDAKNTIAALDEQVQYTISEIGILKDSICTVVKDENSGTSMLQTPSGFTFTLIDNSAAIDEVNKALAGLADDLEERTAWINMTVTAKGDPCLSLGRDDNDYKVNMSNEDIMFMAGTTVAASISNQSLNIGKAVVKNELEQGGFVWKTRANGNLGLMWKGGAN